MARDTESEQVTRAGLNLIGALFLVGILVIVGIAVYWFLVNNGLV